MIVRSDDVRILETLLKKGATLSVKERRAIARHGAIFPAQFPPKSWFEGIQHVEHSLISAIVIPNSGNKDSWKQAAFAYLFVHGLYYDQANWTASASAQDLLDIAFHEYPEFNDPEAGTERETLQDLTGYTTVMHLGGERQNKLFPEIANSLCSQFRSNPTSRCLLWIFEGTRAEYSARYSEIEVDQIIEIGRNTAPGKVETKKVIAENNKTQNTEMWWERI